MNLKPSQRVQSLPGNFFAGLESRIAAIQREGKDVIRLDIGSPDLPPPAHIVETLSRSAACAANHGYQAHKGPQALRQAWVDHYRTTYGVDLDPDREMLPLLGSKEGIFHLAMAWVDPCDAVLIPDPGYMTYERGALFAGGIPYFMPLRPENGFLPDLDAIPGEVLGKAKLLWLNYPNNPTAAVASRDFFAQAVEFARRHNLLLCHDAAYNLVTFDGYRGPSVLEVPGAKDVAVEFNSLSKSHNMAGWRTGVVVGNAEALAPLFKLKTNVDSGHFYPVWEAATAALCGDQSWLDGRNQIYKERRDAAVQGLRRIGWDVSLPVASIYVWCPVPKGYSSMDFVTDALESAQVSLTPGTVFGPSGEGYVRIALTTGTQRIAEAVERLAQWRAK